VKPAPTAERRLREPIESARPRLEEFFQEAFGGDEPDPNMATAVLSRLVLDPEQAQQVVIGAGGGAWL